MASFVLLTLLTFNVSYTHILALTITAVPHRMGAVFRAIWLLPRMSPLVVYALLWLWIVDSAERGLLNQVWPLFSSEPLNLWLDHPVAVLVVAEWIDRCQSWHDHLHLSHLVDPRTSVQRCPRRWSRTDVYSTPRGPALLALADKLYHHLSSARLIGIV